METGIQLIAKERIEQITKHNRTTGRDVLENNNYQLSKAANMLCLEDWGCLSEDEIIEDYCPENWDKTIWEKMVRKPYRERLIIAGALIAAEIDRLTANNR